MDQLIKQILIELRGAWRYRWPAMILAWLVALVGWAIVFAMPNQYEASARVYVDTDSAIRDFLKGMAVEVDLDTRVAYVRQQLLSRPYLEKVARETDLDLRVDSPPAFEALIQTLRQDIQIASGVGERRGRGGPSFQENLYTISYRDQDRAMAEAVVRSLLNAFVDDSLAGAMNQPDSARKFLEEQITLYSGRLSEAERKLAQFKREHVGMIPGERGDYFSRLQRDIEERDVLRNELQFAIQRRDALLRQMQGTEPLSSDVMGPRAELEQRIAEAQARLDELLLAYTDRHPDVITTRETLAALQARLEAMDDTVASGSATNPVFQQAQIALNDAEVEIAGLRSRLASQDRRVTELQQMLDTIPQVEAELQALTRDYEITKTNYEQLVQRLESAKLSGAVGETGEDVAFRIIDPPLAPRLPVAPNRPLLLATVLLSALGAAGALAFLLHQLNPVFNTREQVYDDLGVPVLGAVTMAWTPQQRRVHRISHWSFGVALGLLLIAFSLVFIMQQSLLSIAQRLWV